MRRLLVLAVFALAPLLASAHPGHHAPAHEAAAPKGVVRAIAAAPSRCPGGEESCCCHDAACTPSFQPVAMDAPPVDIPASPVGDERVAHDRRGVARPAPFARHAPRGPPIRS